MRNIFLIILLFFFSCQKEKTKMVTIRGKVNDVGTVSTAENIKVVLFRSNPLDNDGRTSGNVASVYTNNNGEFILTSEVSDNFSYAIKVDESEEEYWLTKEK